MQTVMNAKLYEFHIQKKDLPNITSLPMGI